MSPSASLKSACMIWTMAQRHEYLPCPQHLRRYILPHERVVTAKALFVPRPLEDPMRRVTLFLVNAAAAFKNGVNSRHKRSKLQTVQASWTPAARAADIQAEWKDSAVS